VLNGGEMSKGDDDAQTPEEGLAAALRLLRGRAHTRAQIQDALSHRGFDARTCEDVLTRLTQLGYLDDVKLAEARARRLLQTGYGPLGIEQKLKAMGLDGTLTSRAINEAQKEMGIEEREQAKGFIEHRFKGKWPKHPKDRARAARLLTARGYTNDIIESLLGEGVLEFDDAGD
jgi:regulatory protein